MARLELYPLSLRELAGRDGDRLDALLRGEYASLGSLGWTREDTAEKILAGGYPEAQGKSERGRQIWFRS
ncbi:MAG: ATP-binding protein, partial [Pseudomonadota bacterium]